MNILYASDNNYIDILATSIYSLLDNNKEVDEINIFVIADNIQETNLEKLNQMISSFNRELTILDAPDFNTLLPNTTLDTQQWSASTFSRLFIPTLFADRKDIEKLLYLDCDTLVCSSLKSLYETDITDYLGAAALEPFPNLQKKNIRLDKKNNYINAGVLLVNVAKWRESDIEKDFVRSIESFNGRIPYVDQGIINNILSPKLKIVGYQNNVTSIAYYLDYKDTIKYRHAKYGVPLKEEWDIAVQHPTIIHFTSFFLSTRPWFHNSNHPHSKKWFEYHQKTPFKDIELREKRIDKRQQLFSFFPQKAAILLSGYMFSYVKPLLFRYNIDL